MGRIFAIGDIHGCISHLNKMMMQLDIDSRNDTLVFMGDYVDRGTDSKGVIDTIIEIRKSLKNVFCLIGNHEQMFLNYYREQKDEELFMQNGGLKTLVSYGFNQSGIKHLHVPDNHMEFCTNLQPYYETDSYIFVHAGLRPGVPLVEQSVDDLIWIREEFINSSCDFGKVVVFGHTILSFTTPIINDNKIGIDTGAVFGGKLTCIELPEMKIHQV